MFGTIFTNYGKNGVKDMYHDESTKIGTGNHSTKLITKYKTQDHASEPTGLLTER